MKIDKNEPEFNEPLESEKELSKKDMKDIDYLRSFLGMNPIVKGYRKCLKCGKEFRSSDIKTNRRCKSCLGGTED